MNHLTPRPIPVYVVHLPTDTSSEVLAWTSTIAVVLALILALLAYRKIAKERRTVFELEVLRELLAMFDGSTRVPDPRALALIEALPPDDLVLWRNAAKAVAGRPMAQEDARAAVSKVLDEAGVPPDANPDDRLWKACVKDIQNSISKRTDGLWRRATRRFGTGRRPTTEPTPLDVDQLADKVAEKVATRLAEAAEISAQGQQPGNSPPNPVN